MMILAKIFLFCWLLFASLIAGMWVWWGAEPFGYVAIERAKCEQSLPRDLRCEIMLVPEERAEP